MKSSSYCDIEFNYSTYSEARLMLANNKHAMGLMSADHRLHECSKVADPSKRRKIFLRKCHCFNGTRHDHRAERELVQNSIILGYVRLS